ncbi:DNA-binding protein [Deinococcus cavernae]|uniref:DNA-binding protein n=1 Tax=Deinococcus cavernae TaxID=2320857 RepID=A0A418V5W4_9DEIO|nr:helix-turn-helix domain-containing protein [Deinococcus cavernae]RJF71504.1 DNA-binding protein [Deinococcus cavernae]
MTNKLLSRLKTAEHLSISLSTLERLMKSGDIKGVKVGGGWRISVDELDAFIAKGGTR